MAATVFNQAQLELLDMMQWVKSPEALAELKQVISDFFAKKGQEELDAMWERGEMTEEKRVTSKSVWIRHRSSLV